MDTNIVQIRHVFANWYNINKRDLPWRNTSDPYRIWISEVILQQTRVVQGLDYYMRFTHRFPNVKSLAEAEEGEVLKLWQGLGYYSRARNLHAAAQMVVNKFDGEFPKTHNEILSLKGVGDYTAAAIASFAYDLPHATVDGNVYRVLSRLFGVDTPIDSTQGKKEFATLAQNLLDKENPALHNQAVMEVGALQCVPKSPNCEVCPLSNYCVAYKLGDVESYPVKQGKTKVRNRYFSYLDIRCDGNLLLNRREAGDIWQGLYEFPLIESERKLELEDLLQNSDFKTLFASTSQQSIKMLKSSKHILSHQIIYANFYRIEIDSFDTFRYLKVKEGEIGDYPVSRLVEMYLESL